MVSDDVTSLIFCFRGPFILDHLVKPEVQTKLKDQFGFFQGKSNQPLFSLPCEIIVSCVSAQTLRAEKSADNSN